MSPAQQLHREAMAIAREAQQAQLAGDMENYRKLTRDAFLKEKEAAEHLKDKVEAEPTRSILYSGAAQLAYNCEEYREAKVHIAEALLGNPPEELHWKLRNLSIEVSNALE